MEPCIAGGHRPPLQKRGSNLDGRTLCAPILHSPLFTLLSPISYLLSPDSPAVDPPKNLLSPAFFPESGLTAGKIYTKMRVTATAGNSTPNTGAQREGGWCKPSRDAAGRPPACRGQEMARRPPPLPGRECASARREFRWNHGHFVRPEPKNRLGAFFIPASAAVSRGDNAGAQDRAQGCRQRAGSVRRRRSYRPHRERAEA